MTEPLKMRVAPAEDDPPPNNPERADAPRELIEGLANGDKKSVARLFNLIEDRRPDPSAIASASLDEIFKQTLAKSHVIGITGPPGAGKSCLVSRLIRFFREAGQTVGVIAIDPSSRFTGGALLGDRIRFEYDVSDAGVFVRSMANRGEAGGTSDRAFAGVVALRAAFDVVLVETVGIGQAESDVVGLVDTTVLVIQPGSGDVLQFLKAGIMEEPHIFAVNKADLGVAARRAHNDVSAALGHAERPAGDWAPPILLCSAQTGQGIEELVAEGCRHHEFQRADERLAKLRRLQAAGWIWQTLLRLYGSRGAAPLGGQAEIEKLLEIKETAGPFHLLEELSRRLESRLE